LVHYPWARRIVGAATARLLNQASLEQEHSESSREVIKAGRDCVDVSLIVLTAGPDEASVMSSLSDLPLRRARRRHTRGLRGCASSLLGFSGKGGFWAHARATPALGGFRPQLDLAVDEIRWRLPLASLFDELPMADASNLPQL
jgi:hypothetical protein